MANATDVEVIVPVFNAYDDTLRCLDALRKHLPEHAHLRLIDDASSDPRILPLLDAHPVVHRPTTRVVKNAVNLGFVATVNAAVDATGCDVVLLNSDTRVTSGWLERLLRCAHSGPAVASVTPWSNNAEICSLPVFCRAASPPADADSAANAIAMCSPPTYPELPTAVGFCMYIRREVWRNVGGFDAATFGRGYGEENDWCMRASAHGYRHLLCDDAYVVHAGGASFAGTGHAPGGKQLESLLARYPYYNARIAEFIRNDPLAFRRQALLADPKVAAALDP